MLNGNTELWFIAQECSGMSISCSSCYEGHTLESKQRSIRGQSLHSFEEETRAANHAAHRRTRFQERADLKKDFLYRVAWQTEQNEVGISYYLCRFTGNAFKPSDQLPAVRRTDGQLLLPQSRTTCQQTDYTVLTGSEESCYHMA
jgi:hypothetical protein